ncbi:hypothetical protein D3C85_1254510 [compost metagenome]
MLFHQFFKNLIPLSIAPGLRRHPNLFRITGFHSDEIVLFLQILEQGQIFNAQLVSNSNELFIGYLIKLMRQHSLGCNRCKAQLIRESLFKQHFPFLRDFQGGFNVRGHHLYALLLSVKKGASHRVIIDSVQKDQ